MVSGTWLGSAALCRLPPILVFLDGFQTPEAHWPIAIHSTSIYWQSDDEEGSHRYLTLTALLSYTDVQRPHRTLKCFSRLLLGKGGWGEMVMLHQAWKRFFFISPYLLLPKQGKVYKRDSWMVTIHSFTSKVAYPRYEKSSVSNFLFHTLKFT